MKKRHFKQMVLGICGLAVMGMGVSSASALTIDVSGSVNGWDVTPFTNTAPLGVTGVYGNNTSPINYPNGVGHQPSPGGTTGEKFDLEAIYGRRDGTQVQILLVASSLFQATANGATFNLGDLMIDVDNDHTFDFGVVTQTGNANNGLTAGGLYDITTTRGLQHISGSYYQNASVVNQIGAWAVTAGTLLDTNAIETASHSYANEANTYVYQYTFNLEEELQYSDLYMQFAWGCGNDMIGLNLEALTRPTPQGDPDPETPATPEPATAALGLLSLGGLAAAARRRRSK